VNKGTRPFLLLSALTCAVAGASASDPDARIEAAARRSYNFMVILKDDTPTVSASRGVVTLTGTVANGYHKLLAEETVADLPSVKAVVNLITVQGDQPAETSDAGLVIKVRTVLLYQRQVDASATQVAVKEGIVTLSGVASSPAQRELTGEVARNVEGVKAVFNNMQVVTGAPKKSLAEKIDDASVTAQVKASLLFHRGTHMLATRVKTDRGIVTVRGAARNPAERELVTRIIAGIRGVKRVANKMTLVPKS
jgi:osmotically-inducible protein OsmY